MKRENRRRDNRITRSERISQEQEVVEIPAKEIKEEEITTTNTAEIQVGEIKVQEESLPENLLPNIENSDEEIFKDDFPSKEKKSLNPIPWIAILFLGCLGIFLYLILFHTGNENLFMIDGFGLLVLLFLFGIATLLKRKGTFVFSFLCFLLSSCYLGYNIYFLMTYEEEQNKIVEEESKKGIVKNYLCTYEEENMTQKIQTEDGNMKNLLITFEVSEEEEAKKFVESIEIVDGFQIEQEKEKITMTFDLTKLDSNQYKVLMRTYLDYQRKTSDFTYLEGENYLYTKYLGELEGFNCTEEK